MLAERTLRAPSNRSSDIRVSPAELGTLISVIRSEAKSAQRPPERPFARQTYVGLVTRISRL
jgi:hypothetical protein